MRYVQRARSKAKNQEENATAIGMAGLAGGIIGYIEASRVKANKPPDFQITQPDASGKDGISVSPQMAALVVGAVVALRPKATVKEQKYGIAIGSAGAVLEGYARVKDWEANR